MEHGKKLIRGGKEEVFIVQIIKVLKRIPAPIKEEKI